MGIISRKTAGWALAIGLIFILALNILLIKPFFLGIIAATGLFIIIFFLYRPDWGTGLLLILRPIVDNWGEKANINLTDNFSLSLNALLGILASGLFFLFLVKNFRSWKKIPLKKSWLLLILVAVGSLFYTLDLASTLREIVRLASIFLLFSTIFLLAQQALQPKRLLTFLLFSALVPFLFAFWQLLTQTGLGGTLGLDGRLYGTFSHPNTFAAFSLIIIAISWLWFSQEKNPHTKKILLLLLITGLFFLLETFSRGAWLAFLIFVFTLGFLKSPKIILASVFLFFLVFSFSEDFRFRLQDVYNPSSTSSVHWRLEQWSRGWNSWQQHFWQGWGAGTETVVFENQYGFYAGNPYTHNDLLRAGVETGLVGFLTFGLLFSTVLFSLILSIKKTSSPQDRLALVFIFAIFLAEFVFSLSSNLFRATAIQWLLWSFLAIVLAEKENRKKI